MNDLMADPAGISLQYRLELQRRIEEAVGYASIARFVAEEASARRVPQTRQQLAGFRGEIERVRGLLARTAAGERSLLERAREMVALARAHMGIVEEYLLIIESRSREALASLGPEDADALQDALEARACFQSAYAGDTPVDGERMAEALARLGPAERAARGAYDAALEVTRLSAQAERQAQSARRIFRELANALRLGLGLHDPKEGE